MANPKQPDPSVKPSKDGGDSRAQKRSTFGDYSAEGVFQR